jgi:hypothetical protein
MVRRSSPQPVDWDDLQQDMLNANEGTERGEYMLGESLEQYGAGRSIVIDGPGRIIAGNKTAQAAMARGFRLRVVDVAPDEIIAVRRPDLDLYDPQDQRARGLATADNRVAEVNLHWSDVMLKAAEKGGSDALARFWFADEREDLAAPAAEPDEEDETATPVAIAEEAPHSWAVTVQCGDADCQADVIDFCEERGIQWAAS